MVLSPLPYGQVGMVLCLTCIFCSKLALSIIILQTLPTLSHHFSLPCIIANLLAKKLKPLSNICHFRYAKITKNFKDNNFKFKGSTQTSQPRNHFKYQFADLFASSHHFSWSCIQAFLLVKRQHNQ